MKRRFYSLLCCTALAVAAVNAAESVPYDITFGSFSINQGGWSQQDKNGYPYWGMNGTLYLQQLHWLEEKHTRCRSLGITQIVTIQEKERLKLCTAKAKMPHNLQAQAR